MKNKIKVGVADKMLHSSNVQYYYFHEISWLYSESMISWFYGFV